MIVSDYFDGTPANYGEFKQIIYNGFPANQDQLHKAFSDLDRIVAAFGDVAETPFPPVVSTAEMLPVNNLYIGSTWAMQVGRVPGAVAAAYQCVKEIK